MPFSIDSKFYKKAKQMLSNYIANGGKIEELTAISPEYRYVKNTRVYDDNGNLLDLEAKFELLGYLRKSKMSKNLREDLINEIHDYLIAGGSLHANRKKLPFYERLHAYKTALKRQGKDLTHEEIMKYDLGFREYSDRYFRCLGIEKLKYFRDEYGYVDSYRKHKTFNNYIKEVAQTYNIPIYFVTTLLANEKLSNYEISIDKIAYTQRLLYNYALEHGTFEGIKRKDNSVYEAFNHLIGYYSDGTEQKYSKLEWLEIFGLDNVKNRFRDVKKDKNLDINDMMSRIKQRYQDQIVILKDLDRADYRMIVKKAVALGVGISEVFQLYGLKCKEMKIERLSRVWVENLPYLDEMQDRKNELITNAVAVSKQKLCNEEIFEIELSAVIQVYQEFKEKLESYIPEKAAYSNDRQGETFDLNE